VSFLIWNDLDIVVPWVVLYGLLTPSFMAGNSIIPDCPFFRRSDGSVVLRFCDIKLRNVNIGSL